MGEQGWDGQQDCKLWGGKEAASLSVPLCHPLTQCPWYPQSYMKLTFPPNCHLNAKIQKSLEEYLVEPNLCIFASQIEYFQREALAQHRQHVHFH